MRHDFRFQLLALLGFFLLLLSPSCSGRQGVHHLLLPIDTGDGSGAGKAQLDTPNGRRVLGFQVDPSSPGRYRVDVRDDGEAEASGKVEVRAA